LCMRAKAAWTAAAGMKHCLGIPLNPLHASSNRLVGCSLALLLCAYLCVHAGLGLRLGIAHPQTRRIEVPLTLGIRGKLRIASTPHQATGDVPRAADGVWISASVPDGPHRRHGPLGSWDNLWVRHSRCGLPHALWVRHTLSAWFSGELGFRMLFG